MTLASRRWTTIHAKLKMETLALRRSMTILAKRRTMRLALPEKTISPKRWRTILAKPKRKTLAFEELDDHSSHEEVELALEDIEEELDHSPHCEDELVLVTDEGDGAVDHGPQVECRNRFARR